MFKKLFRKKNIIPYILSILFAFTQILGFINPFCASMYVTLIEEKVPVILPFAFTIFVQYLLFGELAGIRFVCFSLIYALFRAFSKNNNTISVKSKEFMKDYLSKIAVSSCITEILLILTNVNSFANILSGVCQVILITCFSLIFLYGYQFIKHMEGNKDIEVGNLEANSFLILLCCAFSCFKPISFLGINLWSLMVVILLMIIVWKKSILFGLISTISVIFTIVICGGIVPSLVMLYFAVGLVSVLLSSAGKKGALIGLICSCICILIMIGHTTIDNENVGMNEDLRRNYIEFIKKQSVVLSGDELAKYEEELARMEEIDRIKKEAKNTTSSMIIKEMIIAFAILCFMPDNILKIINGNVEEQSKSSFVEKFFKNQKIYRLNPGKNDKEK